MTARRPTLKRPLRGGLACVVARRPMACRREPCRPTVSPGIGDLEQRQHARMVSFLRGCTRVLGRFDIQVFYADNPTIPKLLVCAAALFFYHPQEAFDDLAHISE